MIPPEDSQVKILFRFYSELMEQDAVETMWADTVDMSMGYYKLDSIPLYVPLLASDDLVLAEFDDEEGMLTYRQTIQSSGNSTIWVVMMDDDIDIDDVRKRLHGLDCPSEAISDRFFAMEIKASVNYLQIKNTLNQLRADGVLDYIESCLSVNHQY